MSYYSCPQFTLRLAIPSLRDDPANQSVDEWIRKNPSLLKLISDNKLKYRAFENKRSTAEENDVQVKDLIDVVDDIDKKDDCSMTLYVL